ncbi:MAG TPA: transporter [Elusimicrobiota bacterium]|nr:transporter [Elusimicrobiota bacterium]
MRQSRLWLLFVVVAPLAAMAHGEPFFSERAVPIDTKIVEVGLAPSQRQDKYKVANVEQKNTLRRVDLQARWSPKKQWETKLVLPYINNKVSGGTDSDTDSGLGQTILAGKYAFRKNKAVQAQLEVPTGDQDKLLSEGFNLGVSYLAEGELSKDVHGIFNAGYLFKSEFKSDFDVAGQSRIKVNPGEVLFASVAMERPYRGKILTGELYFARVGKTKSAGKSVSNSDGNVINLACGLTKDWKEWRFKGALALGIGDEEVSSYDLTRPAGDWRLLFCATRRFQLK